jgi:TRAP-type C4-dicarboxylate transport system permease small subunit
MASTPKDTTMARHLLLVCFAFAFPLSIASMHKNYRAVFPAVGLAPAFTSAIGCSILLILGLSKPPKTSKARKNVVVVLTTLFDLIHAGLFIGILIPSWIALKDSWKVYDPVLFTYATVPLLIAFFIHSYLFIQVIDLKRKAVECPNCRSSVTVSSWQPPFPRVEAIERFAAAYRDSDELYEDERARLAPESHEHGEEAV